MHYLCVGISVLGIFGCRNYVKDSNVFSCLSKIIQYEVIGMFNTSVM